MKLDKDLYKKVKKMNRKEMYEFLGILYSDAYQNGSEEGSNIDFKIKLHNILEKTKGIGPKLHEAIMNTVKGLE